MGIPSYFRWIARKFPETVLSQSCPFKTVNRLYFDTNCLIHPVVKTHPEYDIDHMCADVVKYLVYLIDFIHPIELVYIAIDGVPPVGKMKQQRLRRFKSITDAEESNQLKLKYGLKVSKSNVDFNMISPGTAFMNILSDKIRQGLAHYKNIQIIIDDSNSCGEGEHKIFQHLKTCGSSSDKYNIIYGLDADLIMLSLCHQTHHIALLRESTLIENNIIDISNSRYPVLHFLIIDQLRFMLYENVTKHTQLWTIDNIIRDYVFISFILGNDFIPHTPSLNIRDGGISHLVNAYHTVLLKYNNYLCLDGQHINYNCLLHILQELSIDEHRRLIKQQHDSEQRIRITTPTSYEEAVNELQKIEHLSIKDVIYDQPNWREQYYKRCFNIDFKNTLMCQTYIDNICYQYILTIIWIYHYYFDTCIDWYWCYQSHHSPLLSDVVNYLERHPNIFNTLPFSIHQPLTTSQQLLMILPPQSCQLVPEKLQIYMTSPSSPLRPYYPSTYKLDYFGHKYKWEACPKIPLIPPELVDKILVI